MFLESIAHSVPANRFSQQECWDALSHSDLMKSISDRSRELIQKILLGDTGISHRHFATESVESLFTMTAGDLNEHFEEKAPRLAASALETALEKAQLTASELDALFICTCTGYLCPGLSSYVSERLDLPANAFLHDTVGLGCGAAIPTLRSANGFLASHPGARVAVIAVEICSAAFYLDNDPGVLISACLFGDAASASIWNSNSTKTGYRLSNFDTIHKPENRELIRFVNANGKLRNKLHRTIPEKAASAVQQLHSRAKLRDETTVINHTGGRDVIDHLESTLSTQDLSPSRSTLRRLGNTSSPSVLITAEEFIHQNEHADQLWLTSFGAGFAAHSCSLTRS